MPEKQSQSKKIIIALAVVLAVALMGWWLASKKAIQPVVNIGNVPSASKTSSPSRPEPIIPLSGNVLSIAPEKQEMTLGIYRVENNKSVLTGQQVIRYTRETSFARRGFPLGGDTIIKISDRDVKTGDLVSIIPTAERLDSKIVAAEVVLIILPPSFIQGELTQIGERTMVVKVDKLAGQSFESSRVVSEKYKVIVGDTTELVKLTLPAKSPQTKPGSEPPAALQPVSAKITFEDFKKGDYVSVYAAKNLIETKEFTAVKIELLPKNIL